MSFLQINNQSVQDMQIFGDPSHVPVILVEQHIMNVPLHDSGDNSLLHSLNHNVMAAISTQTGERTAPKLGFGAKKNGRILKVVVFVHGFQACAPPSMALFYLICFSYSRN